MRLIDAKALYERIKEHHDLYVNAWGGFKNLPENDKARVDAYTSCIAEVMNSPTIDAVPVVHAWWILKHVGVGHYWECSACRTNPCIYVTENTKFCPNCGARMDGEAE